LSEAQTYSSGLLQARTPTNIEQVTFRPARERLTFARAADGLSVVNGLDATLNQLVYRDGETVYHLSGPLAAGGRQTLTIGDVTAEQIVPASLMLRSKFLYFAQQQPRGSYLAVLDRSPFWDPGVSGLRERDSFHLVLGLPQGQR
jgi:hypothetical protein